MMFVVLQTNGCVCWLCAVIICLTDINLLVLIKLNQTCMK